MQDITGEIEISFGGKCSYSATKRKQVIILHFFIIYTHRHQFLAPTPAVVPLTTTQTPALVFLLFPHTFFSSPIANFGCILFHRHQYQS